CARDGSTYYAMDYW
nr:immunoglobulin heavy chain junction region [Mus musculus]MBK4197936.1 immunoglobulin heavy chain junction region [Mus musculus]